MLTRAVLERTYKAGDRLEPAYVEERSMRYVYQDGSDHVFEDAATGEQLAVSGDAIGEDAQWLSRGMSIDVTLFEGPARS
jgi:elongation factor P